MNPDEIAEVVEERAREFGLTGNVQRFGQTIYWFETPDEDLYRFDGIRPKLGFALTVYEWRNDMVDLDEKCAKTRGQRAFYEGERA